MLLIRKTLDSALLTGRTKWVGLILAVLQISWLATSAAAANLSATLDRDTITLGESAILALTFEGASPDSIQLPAFNSNLQVTEAGTSSQFRIVNGSSSSSVI